MVTPLGTFARPDRTGRTTRGERVSALSVPVRLGPVAHSAPDGAADEDQPGIPDANDSCDDRTDESAPESADPGTSNGIEESPSTGFRCSHHPHYVTARDRHPC